MLKLEKIIKHYEINFRLNGYKKMILYIGIISSLMINIYSLQLKGYPVGELFFSEALPKSSSTYKTIFFKQYGYLFSGVIIGEPLSLLANAIPYIEENEGFKASYNEIVGYFTPDDLKNQKISQTNEQVKETQNDRTSQVQEKVSIEALKIGRAHV